jgi:DNA mismatch repair protein MutL
MGRIRILPDAVINTIAAGEVVERPSAVVKELVENAIDAGASSVTIRIEGGGRKLVEVLDDGSGMDADDAVSALERHATSKLAAGMSLEQIGTLGFRGEALPSIAAVSRLTLTTSMGESGTCVEVEGGVIRSAGAASHPRGTTVTVRDLFYNTPVRRGFLRSPATEMGHIAELFTAIALSRPALKLRLDHGSRRLFDLPPAKDLRARLAQLEGPETARDAAVIQGGGEPLDVKGFILAGRASRQQRARRLVVNGRVVRDRLALRALSVAADEALPSGTPCTAFISLELPADRVDVNVHPAKAEVRFREPGAVYRAIQAAVSGALGELRPLREGPAPWESAPGLSGGRGASGATRESIAGAASAWMEPRGGSDALCEPPAYPPGGSGAERAASSGGTAPTGRVRVVGHYRSGYILAQDEEGLMIVDQHAAHERILFEELGERAAGREPERQALLFPRPVQPPASLRGGEEGLVEDLQSLGFEAEHFGDGTILVRSVPAPLADADPEALVHEVLSSAEDGGGAQAGGGGIEGRRRRMVATAACHAAVKVPAHLTPEKIQWIVETLLECRSPMQCPHGRPTILRWPHREIERRFRRP